MSGLNVCKSQKGVELTLPDCTSFATKRQKAEENNNKQAARSKCYNTFHTRCFFSKTNSLGPVLFLDRLK